MFRQKEVFIGGWHEKTLESMQRRRFEQTVRRLPMLGAERLEALAPGVFARKIEQSWQDIARKPMRAQQIGEVWRCVLRNIDIQADCLSSDEHELVERALILGGCAMIEDMRELEAARALSLRLWGSVGLVSGKPYLELEKPLLHPVARAFSRQGHDQIRRQFESFGRQLDGMLYRVGAIDDRIPQQMILSDVLGPRRADEQAVQLARRYLWASCDCVDYSGGVMLVHQALADPHEIIASGRKRSGMFAPQMAHERLQMDILPEEIPLQQGLERAIAGALRDGCQPQEIARNIRFLCKQGAPLCAMEEVLQMALIVLISPVMRGALSDMYYRMPKWIESADETAARQ